MTPDTITLLDELRRLDVVVQVSGGKLRLDAPEGTLTPDLVEKVTACKSNIMAMLTAPLHAGPAPAFPTPNQWVRNRRISLEAVGYDRFQLGGRPHVLRPDLRSKWLDIYIGVMTEGQSEQSAWDAAWQAVYD